MSFANSFWTQDYHLGYEVLFGELMEGIKENEDFILLFTRRMELELAYGAALQNKVKSTSKRHDDDDYVSTIKNAYDEINMNFAKQGSHHEQIASSIRTMVLEPFLKWCSEHEQRVGYLEQTVSDQYKQYRNARANLEKLQKKYFNKCRMLEEFKSHYTDAELEEIAEESAENSQADESDEQPELIYTFAGSQYDHETATALLADMLGHIELTSHKVPILGTYHNVSSGSAITQWILDNMPEFHGSIVKAETFGQDLVMHGFIRLIGSMSATKNFINSSQFLYQWKPVVFEMTKMSDLDTGGGAEGVGGAGSRTNFANYLEDVKQAMGVTSVDYTDRTQYSRLTSEVDALDTQYFATTKELDRMRCDFEETVMDHLTFMQKCEHDRLKAVKKAMFDFLAAFSNKIGVLKHACDELFVVEETIHPANDLKFLVDNYGTGSFDPRVTLYDNYYDSNVRQTFGVDLNVKSRLDRRAVPVLVQTVLSFLDEVYPELQDDDERAALWTQSVHLSKVHELRFGLNELSDPGQIRDLLAAADPQTVTNVLKLYLMELPDLVVPSSYYDLIRTLYQNYPEGESTNKPRITGLQNTLLELPVCNLATLDALLTHLTRLVHIVASKSESLAATLKTRLCREFGSMVLRPKSSTTKNGRVVAESVQQSFMADLFEHKASIFGELRKRNSLKPNSRPEKRRDTPEKQKDAPDSARASAESSKSRLESRLQRAVNKSDKSGEKGEKSGEKATESSTEKSSGPALLHRSISPKKKNRRGGSPTQGTSTDATSTHRPPTPPTKDQPHSRSLASPAASVGSFTSATDQDGFPAAGAPDVPPKLESDVIVVD